MTPQDLFQAIALGETYTVQFKEKMPHRDSLAAEIVAMANCSGGIILFGVEDATNRIVGLDPEAVEECDRAVSQVADGVKPAVFVRTEVVALEVDGETRRVLVIHVPEGPDKPYKTADGAIYVKQGANKRRVLDNLEIMRMFQQSRNLCADEMEVYGTSIDDIDHDLFAAAFVGEFGRPYESMGLTYAAALKAKRVLRGAQATLGGLLFFGKHPQSIKPLFTIKTVAFVGCDLAGCEYRSKPADLQGTIPRLFADCMQWLRLNLRNLQDGQNFNAPGRLEISEPALIELVENALIHRDYLKPGAIRVMLFDDRLEIVSPGRLPNSLTVEDLRYGNAVPRNSMLVAFASRLMPFSGLGTGIRRAFALQPDLQLCNDVEGEFFKVVIPRPPAGR